MKTTRITGIIILLVIFSLAGQRAEAQSQTPQEDEYADQEREMVLENRRKMLQQQQLEQEMKLQQQKMEQEMKMKQMEIEFAERAAAMEDAREREKARYYIRSSGDKEDFFLPYMHNQGNQTQLTLRNTFHGGSDTSKGDFEVDEDTRFIRCMINGKVHKGEIYIEVTTPGGEVFKEITINSAAEISYSQSLTLNKEDPDDYIGTWEYVVKADEASGNYMLQISTN